MTLLLQNNLPDPARHRIAEIEYRNLAPLYCDEPVKLCGRRSPENGGGNGKGRGEGEGRYELWVETPEGGLAVKGTAYTTAVRV